MKKLSNRLSVKQSSTKEGQRELLREHTNAINELIDIINDMQGMKPYTAMRSTGDIKPQKDVKLVGGLDYLSELLKDLQLFVTDPCTHSRTQIVDEIDKILAIVKGE